VTLRTLQKWHGAGNDFLVELVDGAASPWWNAHRVRALCQRTTGVGADGLLIGELGDQVRMTLYNADGTLAEMSGNGIRCLAGAIHRATNADWQRLEVRTGAGPRTVSLTMDGDAGYASVSMGEVTLAEPLTGTLGVASVGNPHVVVRDEPSWSDALREELALAWSEQVGGANVEFVTVVDRAHVRLRVIERGVGWTMACGTGSCAVAAVLAHAGEIERDVIIANPGGDLRVQLEGERATLSGPMAFVANVEWLSA